MTYFGNPYAGLLKDYWTSMSILYLGVLHHHLCELPSTLLCPTNAHFCCLVNLSMPSFLLRLSQFLYWLPIAQWIQFNHIKPIPSIHIWPRLQYIPRCNLRLLLTQSSPRFPPCIPQTLEFRTYQTLPPPFENFKKQLEKPTNYNKPAVTTLHYNRFTLHLLSLPCRLWAGSSLPLYQSVT